MFTGYDFTKNCHSRSCSTHGVDDEILNAGFTPEFDQRVNVPIEHPKEDTSLFFYLYFIWISLIGMYVTFEIIQSIYRSFFHG